MNTIAYIHPEGQFEGIYTGRYKLAEGSGIIIYGRDLGAIDAILLHLSVPSKRWIAEFNRTSIKLAEDEFVTCNNQTLKEARMKVGNWISP